MALTLQVGQTAAIKLSFFNADGSPAAAPGGGGTVSTNIAAYGKAALDADQVTVHYEALKAGADTISYKNGTIFANEAVNVVNTTAASVSFNETTFVSPDPNPPAGF